MRRAGRAGGLILLSAVMVSGCSSLNPMNWFGAEKPKPAALESFTPKLQVQPLWNVKLDKIRFPLAVAVQNGQFIAADSDGTVTALDAATGQAAWRTEVGSPIVAGVGSDGRYAAVVTRDNEVVTLDGGRVLWRQRVNSRVATPPLVAGERVFVIGVDRAVQAFDALDGRRLWTLQRPGDALTLAQGSVITAFKDTLLVAQGSRLAGVDPLQGTVRWEVPLASPRGTNEVERLADLVGPAIRFGNTVCARAFQSAGGCADADRGVLLWSKNVGGLNAVGGDGELLFGGDASDRITAWRSGNGDVAWTAERLLHRALSGPLALNRAVVFGDFEGQIHFLARDSGATLQRVPTDGSPIVGSPVRAGNTLLAATRNGGLFAFRSE
jgi:outer membrane assembly lipoprotein YfgL